MIPMIDYLATFWEGLRFGSTLVSSQPLCFVVSQQTDRDIVAAPLSGKQVVGSGFLDLSGSITKARKKSGVRDKRRSNLSPYLWPCEPVASSPFTSSRVVLSPQWSCFFFWFASWRSAGRVVWPFLSCLVCFRWDHLSPVWQSNQWVTPGERWENFPSLINNSPLHILESSSSPSSGKVKNSPLVRFPGCNRVLITLL